MLVDKTVKPIIQSTRSAYPKVGVKISSVSERQRRAAKRSTYSGRPRLRQPAVAAFEAYSPSSYFFGPFLLSVPEPLPPSPFSAPLWAFFSFRTASL